MWYQRPPLIKYEKSILIYMNKTTVRIKAVAVEEHKTTLF